MKFLPWFLSLTLIAFAQAHAAPTEPDRMWRDLLGDEMKDEVGGDFYPGLAH